MEDPLEARSALRSDASDCKQQSLDASEATLGASASDKFVSR